MRQPPKYRNKPCVIDGRKFDSQAEGRRYSELKLLLFAGEIGFLEYQPRFAIEVNGVKVCTYTADFAYLEKGLKVVEDVKSKPTMTPVYRLKKKLMKAVHGITISEVQ